MLQGLGALYYLSCYFIVIVVLTEGKVQITDPHLYFTIFSVILKLDKGFKADIKNNGNNKTIMIISSDFQCNRYLQWEMLHRSFRVSCLQTPRGTTNTRFVACSL